MSEVSEYFKKFWNDTRRDAERMWESWMDPHRKHILNALVCVPPFKSLYELGCGSGPNLRLVQKARPDIRLGGSEPNEHLAQWASEHLEITVNREEFPHAPSSEWDVTLSCYALAYADRDTAKETIGNVGSRFLVLVEPCAFVAPFGPPDVYQREDALPHYVNDYLAIVAETGWSVMWRWPIYPDYQGLNMVLIVERM